VTGGFRGLLSAGTFGSSLY